MTSLVSIKGVVEIKITSSDGVVKHSGIYDNLVVTSGKTFIAQLLSSEELLIDEYPTLSIIAVGSGTTQPTLGDSSLGSEITRLEGDVSSSGAGMTVEATLEAFTSDVEVSEAGLFANQDTPVLFSRVVFSPQVLSAGDVLSVVWSVSII